MKSILSLFQSIAADPNAHIREAKKKTGKKVVGYFCSYAPDELIHAAGAIPFRIFGTKDDIQLADSHLQAYCCALIRGGLEEALAGRLDFLDGTLFPHTCDSIQRLSDIWRLNTDFKFHIDAVMPVKLNTKSARNYMIDVLFDVKTRLESGLGVTVGKKEMLNSIKDFNRIRAALRALYEIRSSTPGIFPPSAIHDIMVSAMVMDRGEFADRVEELVEKASTTAGDNTGKPGKRIMISGGICSHPDIYGLLAESGGDVVFDDLCTGFRYADGDISTNGDPIKAIADRYMTRAVCPAKHLSNTARAEGLVDAAKKHRVDGVIFLLLKFCDPHAFDYPYLKQALDDAGIPSLLFEAEDRMPPEGQLRTRFETFTEML